MQTARVRAIAPIACLATFSWSLAGCGASDSTAPSASASRATGPDATAAANSTITVRGNQAFILQTRKALALLRSKAPDAYRKSRDYIGVIEQAEHAGMWAFEQPPRYTVGDRTSFYSVTWYASTIAHDATHSELYHEYRRAHPGAVVPDDAWTGVPVERRCNTYQLDVLKRIGGPDHEITHLANQKGTHADVDGDGDTDWDDFNSRNW